MFAATFVAAGGAVPYPSVFLPSALATLGSALAFWHWQADQGSWLLPGSSMLALTLDVIARFWLGLTASATTLDIIRGGGRWRPTRWVPAWLTQQLGEIGAAISSPPATAHVVPLAARVGLDALGYAVVAAVYDQLGGNPAVSETTHA